MLSLSSSVHFSADFLKQGKIVAGFSERLKLKDDAVPGLLITIALSVKQIVWYE